jgi:hypothetical protein
MYREANVQTIDVRLPHEIEACAHPAGLAVVSILQTCVRTVIAPGNAWLCGLRVVRGGTPPQGGTHPVSFTSRDRFSTSQSSGNSPRRVVRAHFPERSGYRQPREEKEAARSAYLQRGRTRCFRWVRRRLIGKLLGQSNGSLPGMRVRVPPPRSSFSCRETGPDRVRVHRWAGLRLTELALVRSPWRMTT